MSNNNSPRPASLLPLGLRSRRGSLDSLSGSAPIDKEQLSKALDQIHITASHSETLTTFNEFASPPASSSHTESKGITGDIMQNGLSGLYSRFRGAVGGGKDKATTASNKNDHDPAEVASIASIASTKSQASVRPTSKASIGPTREDSGALASPIQLSAASSQLQSPTTVSSFAGHSSESQSQAMKSSKTSLMSTPATSKSATSSRPSIQPMNKATASSAVVPTLAPVNVNAFKDGERGRTVTENQKTDTAPSTAASSVYEQSVFGFGESRHSKHASLADDSDISDDEGGDVEPHAMQESQSLVGLDGAELRRVPSGSIKSASTALSSLHANESTRAKPPSRITLPEGLKRPTAIERITQSHLPGYQASRGSSTDRSTAEATPINTSAHNSVRHESFADNGPHTRYSGIRRIPGTTLNEGAPEAVNTRLEQMRKQVLSKEFWMADDICKECFLCGDTFSAFRRKHHCRTCGCIFDAKCTSIISGQRFGVQGNLRVCKTCLNIINRRHDSSGSEDSDHDSSLPTFFQSQQAKFDSASKIEAAETTSNRASEDARKMPLPTPMMAIPATRRIGDSANRRSAILEIDAPQLSRPGSARSLKSLSASGRPASSGHKRHQSKHNFLGRFKPTAEESAPFHRGASEDAGKKSHLPAFHDDNIIDPDLEPYMSDEGSSADEQMGIFATMNNGNMMSTSFENDRSGFGSLMNAGKKHRARTGEKSVSGISFTTRGVDDPVGNTSLGGFSRPSRRRNLSAASNHLYHPRTTPQPMPPRFGHVDEEVVGLVESPSSSTLAPLGMTRSASMNDTKAPTVELNHASLHHVKRLLRQLLQDSNIPHMVSWEKALIPILLQCTDDVEPKVRLDEDMDIRHFVKVKKIPGGKPGDTSYVSGVVFTKNLALKSMPRSISNPRVVIVSFPIEYQRHQHHFMSLEPVIAQEKEFLRNMVNRIASLRPQLLLVQKQVSGLALQYLDEAGIAVAYNVKQSVIEAVSRFAQTEVISSIDMVALRPVHVGKCAGFDVKTYVHNDIPGKKKTYIYLSGCPKDLGCTISLRGANLNVLSKMKQITEFMVYVVYNLKLETCLMRDEYVMTPSVAGDSGSLSPSLRSEPPGTQSVEPYPISPGNIVTAASDRLQAVMTDATGLSKNSNPDGNQANSDPESQTGPASIETSNADLSQSANNVKEDPPTEVSKYVSAHESHSHGSHDDQVPEDVPMPTFYSDMVAKHQTKILSISPLVKFVQPYLLMRAREQERRLSYLRRLRDQDTFEDQTGNNEKSKPQKFQLIKPEMVHDTLKKAPRPIMEVLHAVHDAEYDKALHNYQTQTRQWEIAIQGNLDLFDPYAHQTITVLYTLVCTETTIPCVGPDLLTLGFYKEYDLPRKEYESDCTLGAYVEDLCESINAICTINNCERKFSEHHRTYVHGEARITVFVEKSPCKVKTMQDNILMWTYCKKCQIETMAIPMSESTWKYSFGKYLELSFWSSELRPRSGDCPHDLHRDHLRYFGFRNAAVRIHYDPIDVLEIVVPRTRITWKVDNDLKLKNEIFTKIEERWNRFMSSVSLRIKGINIDTVGAEKIDACKAEVDRLSKLAQEEHAALIRKLRDRYMSSKYYEIIPLNRVVRAMQEKVAGWDNAFADFDANFFPSEKDIRRLAAIQLRRMFETRDASSTSVGSTEAPEMASDLDEKSPRTSLESIRKPSNTSLEQVHDVLNSVVEEHSISPPSASSEIQTQTTQTPGETLNLESSNAQTEALDREGIRHLDLAVMNPNDNEQPAETRVLTDVSGTLSPLDSEAHIPGEAPLDMTLSEKVEKLRRKAKSPSEETYVPQSEVSGIPRPSERAPVRRSGTATSPPLNRTQSQPAGTLRRGFSASKPASKQRDIKNTSNDVSTMPLETLKSTTIEPVKATDKKLSERLGLGNLKVHRKAGHSLIPRSVASRRKESQVTTLAKHFEQLSREFEKERQRDKKQRAAKVTQARAFPKASSKPIVEVYKDVNEAVEEYGPSDAELMAVHPTHPDSEPTSVVGGLADLNAQTPGDAPPHSPTGTFGTADETATEPDDNPHCASQIGSDDEGLISDIDHSILDDIIPSVAELAEALGANRPDVNLELPKHEKTSLMKSLTNFWAERSASGWAPLDYPINAGDHIFADEDVIIREDEPSSLIAFTLQSQSYKEKLEDIRSGGRASNECETTPPTPLDSNIPDPCNDGIDQSDVKASLNRETGTHLACSFSDGSARMQCKIFYAEQFDAVRRKCGVADRIVESLSRCLKWDSKGGKTKSVFLKTLDDRLVVKSLSPIETAAFLRFAPAYFNIMSEALFRELPTVIAKMLGFYQIIIKNPATGTEIKWDVLVMENLFYDRQLTRIFDLKGSMRNRKIQSTGEQNEVLLDENMVEFIYESPLFAREHSKKLLRSAIFNDTLFLQRNDVMDYSLMVAVDEARKELVVGIIDVVRTYTWDKKLESWIKDRGFAGGGRNRPTVTSPKEYKNRFREAMNRYILYAPNSWHQWGESKPPREQQKLEGN
ncbi:1-phosphatidylinositol 3-phosphate 5-kinase [Lachnellula subtilissima]|uniref:1-phosphatidylinositol-3-phosphate 5-kinase n=1 Tax=Lachnellula subtilissima TaxID=602034 RepID=A0A8H8U6R6_9HELO|nr:1-phosphatidylinositol 3-phosphate 5-kinase [Lachnellula subtilissima]